MAIENPYSKQTASRLNLEAKEPTLKEPVIDLEKRGLHNLNADGFEAWKKSKETQAPVINITNTIPKVATPSWNIDTPEGPSSSASGEGFFNSKAGKATVNGGLAALGEAPSIINNLSTKPETSKAATSKVLSMASSGASIGMAAGPWGAAIGAAVGAGAGLISNAGWQEDLVAKNDEEAIDNEEDQIAERKQNYFLNKTAAQIKAERSIFAEANGIIT